MAAVRGADRLRRPRDLAEGGPRTVLAATGQPVVSFASNDYLGLTQHPAVRAAACAAIDAYGTGAGSARLIVGSRPVHSRLEERIAAWRGTEAAVLFTTGYAANLGVIAALSRWASVICSDELNHASIIDGCRLARAPTRVYPHCDTAAVNGLLSTSNPPVSTEQERDGPTGTANSPTGTANGPTGASKPPRRATQRQEYTTSTANSLLDTDSLNPEVDGGGTSATGTVNSLLDADRGAGMVVSDSVFSMDGDVAPVASLSRVCTARGALLVLDDAHLVLPHPESPDPDCRVLRVGTLSKAVAALGGYVCGPRVFIDLLVNTARSYIFTTAPTPAAAAAASAAIDVIDSPEGDELRARLRANIDRLRPGHPSPIIPIVIGGERQAVAMSEALERRGVLVPAIRPPTVPPGTSRLRVAVSAAHTAADLDLLLDALRQAGVNLPHPNHITADPANPSPHAADTPSHHETRPHNTPTRSRAAVTDTTARPGRADVTADSVVFGAEQP